MDAALQRWIYCRIYFTEIISVCLVRVKVDYTVPSVVPDIARIGIDHGEEDANALPVLLHRPVRCPTRPESVALVTPAQPVIGGAAVSSSANREPFAIDVEGEQHRPGPSLCSAVHSWNGGDTVAAEAPVHENQHPPADGGEFQPPRAR